MKNLLTIFTALTAHYILSRIFRFTIVKRWIYLRFKAFMEVVYYMLVILNANEFRRIRKFDLNLC